MTTLTKQDPGALARNADGAQERRGFLCFKLGEEEFGIDLGLIHQIVKPPPVTWVPGVADHIMGVVSIRGAVVTLIDFRMLMGLDASTLPRTARVLIIRHEEERLGLLVDAVTQVRRLGPDELEEDAEIAEGPAGEHLLGVARPEPELLVALVDLAGILEEKMA